MQANSSQHHNQHPNPNHHPKPNPNQHPNPVIQTQLNNLQKAELNGVILCAAADIVRNSHEDIMQKLKIVCSRLPESFDDTRLQTLIDLCVTQMVG